MVGESVGTIGKSHFIHDLEQVCQTSGIQGLHLQNKEDYFCIKKKHITQWHRSQPKQLKKPNTACIITGATAYLPPRGYNPQNALSKCTGCATCGDRLKAPRQRRCTKIDCFPHRASSALGKSGRSPYTTAPPQSCRAAVSATSSKRPTESAKMPSGNTSGTYRKATDIL